MKSCTDVPERLGFNAVASCCETITQTPTIDVYFKSATGRYLNGADWYLRFLGADAENFEAAAGGDLAFLNSAMDIFLEAGTPQEMMLMAGLRGLAGSQLAAKFAKVIVVFATLVKMAAANGYGDVGNPVFAACELKLLAFGL